MVVKGHIRAVAKPFQEASEQDNALQAELSAMQAIGVALGQLDEPTRARVLQWAEQRFRACDPLVSPPAPRHADAPMSASASPGTPVDEKLSVSALDDFFGPRHTAAVTELAPEAQAQPVTGMLREFVVEFQNIARDWNVACDAPTDGTTAETVRVAVS